MALGRRSSAAAARTCYVTTPTGRAPDVGKPSRHPKRCRESSAKAAEPPAPTGGTFEQWSAIPYGRRPTTREGTRGVKGQVPPKGSVTGVVALEPALRHPSCRRVRGAAGHPRKTPTPTGGPCAQWSAIPDDRRPTVREGPVRSGRPFLMVGDPLLKKALCAVVGHPCLTSLS